MRVLIAFDKLTDAMTSPEACETARGGLAAAPRVWSLQTCPLTDGGEGFCSILTGAEGSFEPVTVTGPRGERVDTHVGLRELPTSAPVLRTMLQPGPGNTLAIVEMASASGLALLAPDRRDPWQTTTI